MYFALGLSVGGVVGANWSKIQPLLGAILGPAAAGFKNAYSDLAEQFAQQAESWEIEPEVKEPPKAKKVRKKKRHKKPESAVPVWFEDFANTISSN